MSNPTYYQRNGDVMLNTAKDYYKNNKKRLREQTKDKCRNLSEEGKHKKREYGKKRYHMSEEEKTETKRIAKKLSRGKEVSI